MQNILIKIKAKRKNTEIISLPDEGIKLNYEI